MEIKWVMIFGIMSFGSIFASMAYEDYTKSDCVKAYATTNRTADDITKICKVK